MGVRVTLNCQIKPDQFRSLLPFLEENLPNVRSFKGCMKVNVLFDKENTEMLLDEEWIEIENHQSYIKHIEGNGVLARLGAFMVSPPQIKYFEMIEI
ncbi:putative quinol monooxygenase [Motiliproteus sp. MSK22-1]|uniref:putative quinol monooxygenase n=1 Tax=Motiliproteus sp. MSK22-1 TaxID=1897630 RepID=UPI0009783C99|nr:antibiotic biosynthesis monooxygenase [Motiliproteus sp. MSK22-1]OMH29074.1 antibiotic biosynthesis monooxygenase [Motiliproteus sp. MSK22-1]